MYRQKVIRDVLVNIIFAGVKAFILLSMIRLAGTILTPVLLGLFLLARRLGDVGANLFQAGSSQMLLRYIPLNIHNSNVKSGYILFVLLFFLGLALILLPLFWILRHPLSEIFYAGYEDSELLVFWTGFLILSMVINFIAISVYVGERRMLIANIVGLFNNSGFLFLAILWVSIDGLNDFATPLGLTKYQALTVAGMSLLVLIPYLWILITTTTIKEVNWSDVFEVFIHYGLPRSLMTFLDAGLFLIGPWLIRSDVAQAGYLIIALTVVRIAQTAIAPINQVVLVVTASLLGRGEKGLIQEATQLMFGVSVYVALIGTSIFIPWTERLTFLWLADPKTVQGVLPYLTILLWGLLPFTLYQGIRGTVEARWIQPRNVYTLIIASSVQIILYILLVPIWGITNAISFSLLTTLWILGGLTLYWVLPDVKFTSHYWGWGRLSIVVISLAIINQVFASTTEWYSIFPALLGTSIILLVFYFVAPTEFVRTFVETVMKSQPINQLPELHETK